VTAHPAKPIEGAGFLLGAKLFTCNEALNEFPFPPPKGAGRRPEDQPV
jgi:hypothetical protein